MLYWQNITPTTINLAKKQTEKTNSFYNFKHFKIAEAICMTVLPIMPLICMMVMPISGFVVPTVLWIAAATGIGYRHDCGMGFSNSLFAVDFLIV